MGRLPLDDLLLDTETASFIQACVFDYEPYDAFAGRPMPHDMDPTALWRLLCFVRRTTGWPPLSSTAAGFSPSSADSVFWNVTPCATDCVFALLSKASAKGELWRQIQRYEHCSVMRSLVITDLVTAANRDGLDLSHEDVRAITAHNRPPDTSHERLAANAYRLAMETPAPTALDADAICALYRGIVEGAEVPSGPYWQPDLGAANAMVTRSPATDVSLPLAAYYSSNARYGTHGLFNSLWASNAILDATLFGPLSGLMEFVLRHASYNLLGIPALAYVPFSTLRLEWEQGRPPHSIATLPFGEAVLQTVFGLDCTPALNTLVALLDTGLNTVADAIKAIEQRNERRTERVRSDARLNPRQREVVEDAICNPRATYDVWTHQHATHVAPATARKDLNDLVAAGYLYTSYEGKRQVFSPNPTFVES